MGLKEADASPLRGSLRLLSGLVLVAMTFFAAACLLTIVALFVEEARTWDQGPAVPAGVWYAISSGLGLWLLVLMY